MREYRYLAGLEATHRFGAVDGVTGEREIADARSSSASAIASIRWWENTRMWRPSSTISGRMFARQIRALRP